MRDLGDLERAVMERLWAWGRPVTVREVVEDLQRERRVAYTTIMTVMANLERKGVLARSLVGRAYTYTPVGGEADHAAALIAEVIGEAQDRTTPLLRFASQLSADEIEELRQALSSGDFASPERRGKKRTR